MKNLTDEEVLLTCDGRGVEVKRLALAAIMARERARGYDYALRHAAESVNVMSRGTQSEDRSIAIDEAVLTILACLNRK